MACRFTGVIAGLFDAGLDVTQADLIIGTSAGSTAAAQITSAAPAGLLADILAAAPQQRPGPAAPGGGRAGTEALMLAANQAERGFLSSRRNELDAGS